MALFGCTQPLTTSMVNFVMSRTSFVNDRVGGFPSLATAGHLGAIRIKCSAAPPSSSFVIKACGGGNDETTTGGFKSDDVLSFDSEFTGESESQYLDYISKLDFEAFQDYVCKFPRKRSEAEKKAIFDRYVELYGRQYVTEELKGKRYGYFISTLDWIDEHNAKNPNFTYGIALTDDLIPCDEQPPQANYTISSFPPGEARNSTFFHPGRGVGLSGAHHWDMLIKDMDFDEFSKSRRSAI